jgi:hypothetical protein
MATERACAHNITLRGDQVRLRLPPEAAMAEGPPKNPAAPMDQSREAHHPARPLHSPEGAWGASPISVDRHAGSGCT